MRFHKNENEITNLTTWRQHAGPKGGDRQWVDGYSAKELARAWFPDDGGPRFPAELRALLDSDPLTRDVTFVEALPECRVKLDDRRGERRNTDLVLVGDGNPASLVLSLEAKAAESFDHPVGRTLALAEARREMNERSRGVERAHELLGVTLGVKPPFDDDVLQLRYQLFTATVGAVRAALHRRAPLAALVIHEFADLGQEPTNRNGLARNASDLRKFCLRLTRDPALVVTGGRWIGPVQLRAPAGANWPPLLIGKIVRLPGRDTDVTPVSSL